jgi:hypothetical protein
MLTQLSIQNSKGQTLALPMSDVSGGYAVRDIQGLDPVKATQVATTLAQVDGGQYQYSRRDARNITFKIGFVPNYASQSVASLRNALYNYLFPKSVITLIFYVDGSYFAQTVGVVESCSAPMFSQDPEVDVSVMCYDPDFYAQFSSQFNGTSVTTTTTSTIAYAGTTDTGIIFSLTHDMPSTSVNIYNIRPDGVSQRMTVALTSPDNFVAGDILTIDTRPGSKAVVRTRGGVTSSILYALDPTSDWISLQNGNNAFRVVNASDTRPYTVGYTNKYGAI